MTLYLICLMMSAFAVFLAWNGGMWPLVFFNAFGLVGWVWLTLQHLLRRKGKKKGG